MERSRRELPAAMSSLRRTGRGAGLRAELPGEDLLESPVLGEGFSLLARRERADASGRRVPPRGWAPPPRPSAAPRRPDPYSPRSS